MARLQCPVCQKSFASETCKTLPFCSARCQQIDLGRWLDERYGLPWEPENEADEPYLGDDDED